MNWLTKLKKLAHRAGTDSTWSKHVNKYTKQKANKVIRRELKKEMMSDD